MTGMESENFVHLLDNGLLDLNTSGREVTDPLITSLIDDVPTLLAPVSLGLSAAQQVDIFISAHNVANTIIYHPDNMPSEQQHPVLRKGRTRGRTLDLEDCTQLGLAPNISNTSAGESIPCRVLTSRRSDSSDISASSFHTAQTSLSTSSSRRTSAQSSVNDFSVDEDKTPTQSVDDLSFDLLGTPSTTVRQSLPSSVARTTIRCRRNSLPETPSRVLNIGEDEVCTTPLPLPKSSINDDMSKVIVLPVIDSYSTKTLSETNLTTTSFISRRQLPTPSNVAATVTKPVKKSIDQRQSTVNQTIRRLPQIKTATITKATVDRSRLGIPTVRQTGQLTRPSVGRPSSFKITNKENMLASGLKAPVVKISQTTAISNTIRPGFSKLSQPVSSVRFPETQTKLRTFGSLAPKSKVIPNPGTRHLAPPSIRKY